jgi:ribosomal protein S9
MMQRMLFTSGLSDAALGAPVVVETAGSPVETAQAAAGSHPQIAAGILEQADRNVVGEGGGVRGIVAEMIEGIAVAIVAVESARRADPQHAATVHKERPDVVVAHAAGIAGSCR